MLIFIKKKKNLQIFSLNSIELLEKYVKNNQLTSVYAFICNLFALFPFFYNHYSNDVHVHLHNGCITVTEGI